jgi:hypothetical protein
VVESVSTGVMKGRVDVVEEVGRTGGLKLVTTPGVAQFPSLEQD